PYTVSTVPNLFYMTMVTHNLNPNNPEDVAFAKSRIRAETCAAEDVLHDLGVISMFSSDSQAMGRVDETVTRCIQTADKMKRMTGKLPEDHKNNDNFRVMRYLAKLTINPAITNGIAHAVGSLERGKIADIVLWSPAYFGVKPKLVVKGGLINWSLMGDPNASITTPEPVFYRPMFGALGKAVGKTCATFLSKTAIQQGIPEKLELEHQVVTVQKCRGLQKKDMVLNDRTPKIEIDPETYKVYVDGKHATVKPAEKLALTQLYSIV
ncbi:MAG: urease subunit alpha, partial [Ktedonobacteraceae bacterium]